MSSAGDRQKRLRARQRNGQIIAPVCVTNAIIEALLDRGWLLEADSEDRKLIGCAVADLLGDFMNLPTKNSVTRHGRKRGVRASIGHQEKPESDQP